MANSTVIYACTADGLAIFNKPGTLPEWLPPRVVLHGRAVLAAWAEPGPPIRVLAAAGASEAQPAGLLLSENGGREWQTALDGPVTALLGPDADESVLYAGFADGRTAKSADRGAAWTYMPPLEPAGRIMLLERVEQEAGALYAVVLGAAPERAEAVLLKGTPEEGKWQRVAVGSSLSVAQAGATYVATPEGVTELFGGEPAGGPLSSSGPLSGSQALVAIPAAGGGDGSPALVVARESGFFISPDGGASWQSGVLPEPGTVTALARDPERRDRLYCATKSGFLFESGSRGQTWTQVNMTPVSEVLFLYVMRI